MKIFWRQRGALPIVVAWAIFLAYVLAARGVRNFFPISAFDMYQARSQDIASRVLVVDEMGKPSELTQYEAFRCDPPRPELANVQHCLHAGAGRVEYVLRDAQIHLDAHLTPDIADGTDVKLVWRTFTLKDRPGPPAFTDCVLATCRVRGKGRGP
ncbi:MAG: hypothetical protein IPM54_14055 [Polyangiaceae bacterium]|nr:hypothetical protein [Polyangiaceae bacterium]